MVQFWIQHQFWVAFPQQNTESYNTKGTTGNVLHFIYFLFLKAAFQVQPSKTDNNGYSDIYHKSEILPRLVFPCRKLSILLSFPFKNVVKHSTLHLQTKYEESPNVHFLSKTKIIYIQSQNQNCAYPPFSVGSHVIRVLKCVHDLG